MHARRVIAGAIATGMLLTAASAATSAPPPRRYKNCTALHRVYPHGVGRRGAHDHTSGTPVTNFKVSNRLYRLNRHLDRDHDGIACEKR